jgi:hypothetical protein
MVSGNGSLSRPRFEDIAARRVVIHDVIHVDIYLLIGWQINRLPAVVVDEYPGAACDHVVRVKVGDGQVVRSHPADPRLRADDLYVSEVEHRVEVVSFVEAVVGCAILRPDQFAERPPVSGRSIPVPVTDPPGASRP